jgi:glycosyl transferase, family 25
MRGKVLTDNSLSNNALLQLCGIYLINLDRSVERLSSAERRFNAVGLPIQRIDAIDAYKEDVSVYPIDREAFQRTHGRKSIRPGEIGCYFSHLKAIRAFLASDKEFAIILEDDVLPQIELPAVLKELLALADEWDIVSLFHFHRGGPVVVRQAKEFSLAVHVAHISSAAAYLVSKNAAKKLIQHLEVMRACLDHSLYESWKHGLQLRSVTPMPIHLAPQANQSTINIASGDKPFFLLRLPTLLNRSYVAVRVLFYGLVQIFRSLMKSS